MSDSVFEALKRYAEFTADDAALLRAVYPRIERHAVDIVDDFYRQILANEGTRRILADASQVERLKQTLVGWLREVFLGPHDEEYCLRRMRIGQVHVQVGLPQAYVFAAMSHIRRRLERVVFEDPGPEGELGLRSIGAIHKVLDLDLALIAGSYHEAEKYRDLVESAPEMIHEIDRTGHFVSANQTERRCLGLELRDLQERRFEDLLAEPDREVFRAHLQRVFERGHSRCEVQVRAADGRTLPVEILATGVRDPVTGEILRTRAYVRDVSERKQAEEALRRERDAAQRYLDVSDAILCVVNTRREFTLMNRRGLEVLGYRPEELIGQPFEVLLPAKGREDVLQTFRSIIDGELVPSGLYESTVITRKGEPRIIEWRHSLLRDESGALAGILSSGLDVTDRRRMERALVEQTSLARLGEMAAVVAHEIKNPLAGIGGAIQVMSSQLPLESSGRMMAEEILERLDALNDTVNDLLLFARPRLPRLSPVPVLSLFEDIVALLRQDPQLEGVIVDTRIPDIVVPCDADLLKPAFVNILLNAAQAMKGEGRVRIAVESTGEVCRIAISDTGPGIPAELRERIFEPFFSTKHRGTGLGLPIAKRIVESHGGNIEIHSPDGGGTTVTIDLPLRPAQLLRAPQR